MRPGQRRFLYMLLLLGGVLTACSLPSDARLLNLFEKNKAQFEEILDFVNLSPRNTVLERLDTYLEEQEMYQVFKKELGVRRVGYRVFKDSNELGLFFELAKQPGLGPYTSYKGIVFLPQPPATEDLTFVVPSLDNLEPLHKSETHYFFRPIEGNWYLYQKERQ